jgi:DNA-binding MurR/RpiR family transcriptional regulator
MKPPRDFESLKSLIIENNDALPKRLRQVAVFALENPDDIAFGTAASIAERADVQPSTLVRFAQSIGYGGFSDLQNVFRARLRERSSTYEERLEALSDTFGRLRAHPSTRSRPPSGRTSSTLRSSFWPKPKPSIS